MKKRTDDNVNNIAYRFLVMPSDEQKGIFAMAFGCKRFIYNTMLYDESFHYQQMGTALHNEVTDYKDVYPFLCKVDSLVLANAKLSLDRAFESFFNGDADYPTYKKKTGRQSFTTNCSNKKKPNLYYDESGHTVKLPKVREPLRVRAHRRIKPGGVLKSATVSLEPDGRYYISLLYEYPEAHASHDIDTLKAIGLDMSMGHLYMDSNGDLADYPNYYRLMEPILAREQAKLSHMVKGSNNYKKQKKRIARLHAKTKHQRRDFLEKLSYNLVMMYDIICIESLSMKGMSRTLNLGKSVHDIGWGSFVSMLERKCRRYGKKLIKVDRSYPSTQRCSCCGSLKPMQLSERLYQCPVCDNFMDRDWNSAVNILEEGLRIYNEQLLPVAA